MSLQRPFGSHDLDPIELQNPAMTSNACSATLRRREKLRRPLGFQTLERTTTTIDLAETVVNLVRAAAAGYSLEARRPMRPPLREVVLVTG